jgi:hypothetical protein
MAGAMANRLKEKIPTPLIPCTGGDLGVGKRII